MEKVYQFLKEARTYYLATMDGDQPRVRPFGTYSFIDGKLYIQTAKSKDCSKQMQVNPKVELCAFNQGKWLRVTGTVVRDDRVEMKKRVLDDHPFLRDRYNENDDNTEVLYFENVSAVLYSFTDEPVKLV